ncbi:ThuA domain-containing protein [Singulisphaera sp. PoT]|uniref:ThuA domain-containing protein n=1 Tax=Singulisphaera sp. PoT TaxID=3411797 RepID=UPI003BF49ADD
MIHALTMALGVCLLTNAPDTSGASKDAKARALIITGVNNHDWKATTSHLESVLENSGYFDVDVSEDPDASILDHPEKLRAYQVLVLNLNRNSRWAPEREKNFLAYVRGGGGLVVVHAADNAFPGWDEYDRLVGGTWRSRGTSFPDRGTFHPDYGSFQVKVVDKAHPITRGIDETFNTTDEMYTNLKLQDNIHVLAQGTFEGKAQPLLFVANPEKGRMFQTALGHDLKAMNNRQFIDTLIRGTRWAAGQLR